MSYVVTLRALCEAKKPMAIFHCQAKPISRSAGRSATGAAAYRAGEKVKDERTGDVHDYTRKQGVECAELVFPSGVSMSRAELWNLAELAEKRKDARVAREWEIALPAELPKGERRELALAFANYFVEQYGVAADVAIHAPSSKGDERNFHAHILITTRRVTAQGLESKADLELEDKALRAQRKKTGRKQIEAIRARWASLVNMALLANGITDERVSHKSLKEQGIEDREPTQHLGVAATAMERRGVRSERGDLNRHCVERQQDKAELELLGQEQRDEEKRQELAKQREDLEQEKKREKPEPKPAPRPVKGIEAEEKRQEAEAELAKVMRERLLQKAKRLFSTEERETPEPKPAPRPVRTVKVIDDEDEKDKKETHAAWEARRRKEDPVRWMMDSETIQQYETLKKEGWAYGGRPEDRLTRDAVFDLGWERKLAADRLKEAEEEKPPKGLFRKVIWLFQYKQREKKKKDLLEALLKAREAEAVAKVMHQRATDIEKKKDRVETARTLAWKASPEYKAYEERHQAREAEKKQIRAREQKLGSKKKRGFSR